jgi:hypothetical protein
VIGRNELLLVPLEERHLAEVPLVAGNDEEGLLLGLLDGLEEQGLVLLRGPERLRCVGLVVPREARSGVQRDGVSLHP